jgi:K+-sensing histidine kinase KdpD
MRSKPPSPELGPALLSLAVHELRTPATVVAGYIRMLLRLRGDTLTDEQRKFVQGAERSCDHLTDLLAELGDLSKLAAGSVTFRRAEVSLFRLAAEVVADLHIPAEREIRFEVRGADTEAAIMGDRDWLRLALHGLFSAPVRERLEPGVLLIECALRREAGRSLAVVGAGESEAVTSLLRASPLRWGSLDQLRAGLGFALPVAKLVIDAHNGRAGSPRGPNSRAAVAVALPLKRRPAGAKPARRRA